MLTTDYKPLQMQPFWIPSPQTVYRPGRTQFLHQALSRRVVERIYLH